MPLGIEPYIPMSKGRGLTALSVKTETLAIGLLGQSLYDQEIRPKVEEQNKGKFLVLDVNTGDYEIDAEDLAASDRLLVRHPDAALYGVRIGFPTAYKLGGKFLKKPR